MAKSKIWKLKANSPAQTVVTDDAVFLVGSETKFLKVNDKGTTIYGPISLATGSESIKTSGMFVSLPDLTQMIPSTTFSPIPAKIPVPPLNLFFDIAEDISYFSALLS